MKSKAGMSQAQKLEKVLRWFYDSATCHTLKDLETSIPAATKINKMQVKDLIKELTDTNQVKVEKIGSGNWYWAWAGEQISEKTTTIEDLESEKAVLEASITSLQSSLAQIKAEQAVDDRDPRLQSLSERLESLENEVRTLTTEKDEWENAVSGSLEQKEIDTQQLKREAMEATDNIYALEDYLQRVVGISRDQMSGIRMELYGKLCAEGEELPELDET